MSVLFPVLVYFVINSLGMSDNAGFFDIVTILPHVLVLLVGKMAENGSRLTKINVYLENTQNADPEKCFFFHAYYIISQGTPQCFKSRRGIVLILKHWRQNDPFVNIYEKNHFFCRSKCPLKFHMVPNF